MLISVLIAAYKAGPHIRNALASVRAQTHADWELVVVEDGSRDETEGLVEAFSREVPQSVRYLNHGRNRGVAEARNTLLEAASGEAVAFLDADDLWEPTHLENARALLEAGAADFVAADVRAFNLATGETLKEYSIADKLDQAPAEALLRESLIVTSSCVVLRTRLARSTGRFLGDLRVGEDRDYWLRCALAGARFHAAPPTCHYAKHAGSTMARTRLVAEQEVLFHEKYLRDERLPLGLRRRLLAHCLCNLARLTRASDRPAALRHLLRAWRLTPLRPSIPVQLLATLATR